MKKFILLFVAVSCSLAQSALAVAKTWDGGGGDGLWATAANWDNDTVPATADTVTLDNSVVSGIYTVTLPSGTATTTITKLTITPNSGNNITLLLPSGNTASTGFKSTDGLANTDDIVLDSGAILKNSSGAGSGPGMSVTNGGTANGTLVIKNGARCVINLLTGSSSAGLAASVSSATGTEGGIFEMDLLAASGGLAASVSGRTFGTYIFSKSSGAATYTISGSSAWTMKSNLVINTGATISADTMSGTLIIGGNFTNNGGTYSSGGGRTVQFNGTSPQVIAGTGTINLSNVFIYAGSSVTAGGQNLTLNGSLMTVSNGSTFTVASGANFRVGSTATVTGPGTFILNSGGTLWIASTAGITASSASGNIQTTTRNYSSSANYVYNGTAAQAVGDGLPSTVNALTITNAGGVTLAQAITISSGLQINAGKLSLTGASVARTLSFDGGANFQATGTWGATGSGAANIDDTHFAGSGTVNVLGAIQYWDLNGSAAGIGGVGPADWDAATQNWTPLSDGTGAPQIFDSTLLAIFGGTAGTVNIPSAVSSSLGVRFDVSGYTVQSGALTLNLGGTTITVANGADTATINSTLSGSSGLIKAGAGTLAIGGNNNFTATATINAGTLSLSGGSALADTVAVSMANTAGATLSLNSSETIGSLAGGSAAGGNVNLGSSTLTVGDTTSTTFGGVISDGGNGALVKQGSGALTLTNASTFAGKTTINGGKIIINSDSNFGTPPGSPVANQLTLNGGTIQSSTAITLSANRGITLGASGGTILVNSTSDITYGGNITGAGALTKGLSTGTSGNLSLSGVNDFSGGLTLTGGGLRLNSDTSAGTGTINLVPAGSSVTLRNLGVAASTITNAIAMSNSGGSSTISFDSDFGGTFTLTGPISGTVSANQALIGANTTGGGTIVLSGNSSWSGGLNLRRGTLSLGQKNALGTGTFGINPVVGSNVTVQATTNLTGANAITNSLTISNGCIFAGSSSIEFSGPLTLITGLPSGPASPVITNNNSGNIIFSGAIGDGGSGLSLTVKGTGTLTLSGANTYSGGTTLSAGTLKVSNSTGSATGPGPVTVASGATLAGSGTISGTVAINGTISPGNSPGTITTGAETWNGGGAYFWEVNNLGNDLINANSLVVSSTSASKFTIGLNALEALTGWNASVATSWTLVHTTGSITGFTNVSQFNITNNFAAMGNTLAGSFTITTANGGNDLVLSYIPPSAVADTITREGGVGTKVLVSVLLANDVTGGTKTMTGVSATSASGNDVQMVGAYVYYSINVADPATDTFTYTLSDGTYTATGTVTVNKVTSNAQSQNVTASGTQGNMTISFAGIPGFNYNIQYTTDLAANPIVWTTVATITADAKGQGSYQDNVDHGAQAFYRTSAP